MATKSIVRLVAHLTFGIDTLTGLGSYLVLSFLFQEPLNFWFLLVAGFFAYFPDIDLLWFLFQSRQVRKWGHWRFGLHHPLMVLPLTAPVVWVCSTALARPHALFLTVLAVVCVFGHFVHDSMKMGLHWLSPFTRNGRVSMNPLEWMHVRVTVHGPEVVERSELVETYATIARESDAGGARNEIETRLEPITSVQRWLFVFCLAGLVLLATLVGYRLPF